MPCSLQIVPEMSPGLDLLRQRPATSGSGLRGTRNTGHTGQHGAHEVSSFISRLYPLRRLTLLSTKAKIVDACSSVDVEQAGQRAPADPPLAHPKKKPKEEYHLRQQLRISKPLDVSSSFIHSFIIRNLEPVPVELAQARDRTPSRYGKRSKISRPPRTGWKGRHVAVLRSFARESTQHGDGHRRRRHDQDGTRRCDDPDEGEYEELRIGRG